MARAAVYLRRSRTRGTDDPSLSRDAQEAACLAFVHANGWDFDPTTDLYVDWGRSAYRRDAKRPRFEAMLAAVTEGRYQHVVSYRLDRLTRQFGDWGRMLALAAEKNTDLEGVTWHSATEGVDSKASIVVLATLAGIAQQESTNIGKRVLAAKLQAKRQGRWPGGVRPFGWAVVPVDPDAPARGVTLDLHPDEAPLLQAAVNEVIHGAGLASIARRWNEQGVKTTLGNAWWPTSLHKSLSSPLLLGMLTETDPVTKRLRPQTDENGDPLRPYPAMVDQVTFDRLQAVLASRRAGKRRVSEKRALLSGILTCHHCGARLGGYAQPNAHNASYRCPSATARGRTICPGVSVSVRRLDSEILELATDLLGKPENLASLLAPPAPPSAAMQEEAKLLAKLDRLEDRMTDGDFDDDDGPRRYKAQKERLLAGLERARSSMPKERAPDASDLIEAWLDPDEWSLDTEEDVLRRGLTKSSRDDQRRVIQALIRGIQVTKAEPREKGRPRGYFDQSRVLINLWQDPEDLWHPLSNLRLVNRLARDEERGYGPDDEALDDFQRRLDDEHA